MREEKNKNTDILRNREAQCIQKLYFMNEDFSNEWPEYEIIYKCRYVIGVIDEKCEERDI